MGVGKRSGIPHLTPTLSAPGGGEGDAFHATIDNLSRSLIAAGSGNSNSS